MDYKIILSKLSHTEIDSLKEHLLDPNTFLYIYDAVPISSIIIDNGSFQISINNSEDLTKLFKDLNIEKPNLELS